MTLTEMEATSSAVSVRQLLDDAAVAPTNSPTTVRDYLHHIAVGGWPLLVGASEATARTYLNGYLRVIVEHDIDEVSGATRNPRLVRRFLHAYAQMTAQPSTLATVMKRARDEVDDAPSLPSRPAAQDYLDASADDDRR